jgi:hypothetical protein
MNKNAIILAAVSGVLLLAQTASAETSDASGSANGSTKEITAPEKAVELTVGTGYAQGFGDVGNGQATLQDVGKAGGAVELGVGYRVTPSLMIGVYGTGSMYGRSDGVDSSTKVYSSTAGVQAAWHFLPTNTFDPWVALGTGWRGYWVDADRGVSSMHGLELARLQLGADYRLTDAVAISPVFGIDMSTFLTKKEPGSSGFANIDSPKVNTFIFAGLLGRFDIATSSSGPQVAKL